MPTTSLPLTWSQEYKIRCAAETLEATAVSLHNTFGLHATARGLELEAASLRSLLPCPEPPLVYRAEMDTAKTWVGA